MTLCMADGFDFWSTIADAIAGAGPATWDTFTISDGFGSGSTNTRFTLGQSISINYNGILSKAVTNTDPIHHVAFAIRKGSGNGYKATLCYWCLTFYDSSSTTAQCSLALMGDGSFRLYTGAGAGNTGGAGTVPGGTLLFTTGILVPAGTWTGVEFELKIDNAAGYCNIRINGNTVNDYASAANLNTRNGTTNAYANKLTCYDQGGSYADGANKTYLDDLFWFTTAGSAPNAWVGDIRSVQQLPASDSAVQMTPNSGTNNYSRVNQAVEDGDTTYVSTSTAGANDLYGIAALATTPATILAVQTKVMARKTDTGTHTLRAQLKSGTTTVNGTVATLSTSYLYSSRVDTVDPNTSAAWTASAVNSLLIGAYLVS